MNATLLFQRITLCVVLLLITPVLNAQTQEDTASPSGWLLLPERQIELEIHQEGQNDSSHTTGSHILIVPLLRILTEAGYTVFLSPYYLKEEIAFFREPPKLQTPPYFSQRDNDQNRDFLMWLEKSLGQQKLDLKSLASLKNNYQNKLTLPLPWPWWHDEFPNKQLRLATLGKDKCPVLQVSLKWTTRTAGKPGHKLIFHGLTADLRMINGTATAFFKQYPEEAWKSSYEKWEDTPAYQVAEKFIKDIRIGLSPTTKSKDTPQKRKVGNELSSADESKVGLHFGVDSFQFIFQAEGKTYARGKVAIRNGRESDKLPGAVFVVGIVKGIEAGGKSFGYRDIFVIDAAGQTSLAPPGIVITIPTEVEMFGHAFKPQRFVVAKDSKFPADPSELVTPKTRPEDSANVVVPKASRVQPEVTFQKKADKILPAFTDELNGQNPVRVRNPNEFAVAAGVRSAKKGKNLNVPANGVETVYIPDGKYDIYFVYSNKPEALFQGDSFTLKHNGVEIQIVKVVNGNYSIRQVK